MQLILMLLIRKIKINVYFLIYNNHEIKMKKERWANINNYNNYISNPNQMPK